METKENFVKDFARSIVGDVFKHVLISKAVIHAQDRYEKAKEISLAFANEVKDSEYSEEQILDAINSLHGFIVNKPDYIRHIPDLIKVAFAQTEILESLFEEVEIVEEETPVQE